MKIFKKLLLKFIRLILGKIILLLNFLLPPRAISHTIETKVKLDQQTQALKLYQFKACPFCVKVRRQIKRLGLTIEIRDILTHPSFESQLIQQGGKRQVPCLLIINPDKSETWLYESDAINDYLQKIVLNIHSIHKNYALKETIE